MKLQKTISISIIYISIAGVLTILALTSFNNPVNNDTVPKTKN